MENLKELAAPHFGELTAAEIKLLEAVTTGSVAECGGPTEEDNDPSKAAEWPDARTIRSSIIRWLCNNKDVLPLIDSSGIAVAHARLVGELNLAAMAIPFSLRLQGCGMPEGISVQDASLRNLDLEGSVCSYLRAWRLNLKGSLYLRSGFIANGPVMLNGALISGDLECVDAHFNSNPALEEKFGVAPNVVLVLDRANIAGRIHLDRTKAFGIIYLVGVSINGSLECLASKITIGINMRDAQSRSIIFRGTRCPYLVADRIQVKGSVFLRNGFRSEGTVVLLNCSISGDLDCNRSHFGALSPDPEIRKSAEKSFGPLPAAALVLNSSSIGGYLFLGEGFHARGRVTANGVNIGANLICNGGRFYSPSSNADALSCQFTHVRGSALFRNTVQGRRRFQTNGTVNFFGAKIEGSLSFTGAQFLETESGVGLQNAVVGGALEWKQIALTAGTTLNLSHARVGQLDDDYNSWPAAGKLVLDGLSYDAIVGVPLNSEERKLWLRNRLDYLRRQGRTEFSLQPHRKLAEILRQSGYEDNARSVLIDMHKARREQGGFSRFGWVWSWILQGTIGFGYRSHWAFGWSLFFVIVGALFFRAGYHAGYLVSVKAASASLPEFSSIAYSLDTFLPIINLHQEEFWMPAGYGGGRWLQAYYWLHICLGWALITLGVAGFTGLIRKD